MHTKTYSKQWLTIQNKITTSRHKSCCLMEISNLTILKKRVQILNQFHFTFLSCNINSLESQFLLYHVLEQVLILKKELGVKHLSAMAASPRGSPRCVRGHGRGEVQTKALPWSFSSSLPTLTKCTTLRLIQTISSSSCWKRNCFGGFSQWKALQVNAGLFKQFISS